MKKALQQICFLFLSFYLSAQDSIPKNKLEIALNAYVGYLIPAYPGSPKSSVSYLNSVGFQWQTMGKDPWHQLYRFPKYGFEFFYSTFSNPSELGYNIGIVPSLEWHGKKPNKNWRMKFGMGMAYFNNPFDLVTNPTNFYIGRHFTNMSVTSIFWTRRLSKDMALTYGISSIHASDGHTALPNAGMNIFCGHLGLRFEKKRAFTRAEFMTQPSRKSFVVKMGIGYHEFGATTKAIGGPRYPSYHLSGWYSRSYKNIHLLQIGITMAYYTSFYDYIKNQEVYKTDQQIRSCTGIAFIGHEFVFGKFGFVSQAGIYFFNPFFIKQKKIEGSWHSFGQKFEAINTNRIGVVYYPLKKRNSLNNIGKQICIGAYIKANAGQADLFEYSLGYSF